MVNVMIGNTPICEVKYRPLECVPTWALLEELKRRKGVTYAAKATGDLVGCIESAPAVAITVKLPLEE